MKHTLSFMISVSLLLIFGIHSYAPVTAEGQNPVEEWQRYARIPHPADSIPFPVETNRVSQPLSATVTPSALNNPSPAAYRGNIELVFQAEETTIEVAVNKQDINVANGADELAFTIFDAFEEAIVSRVIADDGNTSNNFVLLPPQRERFTVSLPAPGLYTLRTAASRDVYYDLAVSPQKSALISTLEFIDGTKSLDLYFQAPANQLELNISTTHFAGLTQTLRVHDSNGQVVERLFLNEIATVFTLRADIPPAEEGKLWRLHIPKQDLVLQSQQVRHWFRSPDDFFDFDFSDSLLQLRVLEMAGIAGMRVPFRFEMTNTRSTPIEVFPVFQRQSGFELKIEPHPASIPIAGATKNIHYFHALLPEDVIPGDESTYLLSLQDANGRTLVSSKINVHAVEQKPLNPQKQFLFFTPERLEEIRRAGQTGEPYQRSIYNSLIQTADRFVAERLPVPDEEAFWTGTYICDGIGDGDDDPNDGTGAPLIFDPLKPGVYICSLDGERYQGERYRQGWLGHYHFEMCNRIRTLGFAYHLEPKPEYAEYIRELLIGYADRYRSFPLDDYLGNRSIRAARLMTETLGEAMCLTQFLQAYDAVRADSLFSQADRAHIEWNLIRPAVAIIQSNPMDITNWQSWHNTAIGLAGFLMDDEALMNDAIYGQFGQEFVKTVSIRDDGIWQEGSVGYHFFGMLAMNVLLEAMDAHGMEAFDEKIELAYSSVLDVMQPDGMFPSLNDSAADFIQFRNPHYEIANRHFENPVFDEVLAFIYETRGFERGILEALFFGKEFESNTSQPQSVLKDRMGLSLLRSGNQLNDQLAMMDYGPHGQFHGHFDKLHLSMFGAGEDWLPDLGTGATNIPEFTGWFRTTIGHNTIMVGERPQDIDTEEERPIRFFQDEFPGLQVMQAEFGAPVYPAGSNIRRTVLTVKDEYAVVIDDVSGAPSPIDIVFHSSGKWHAPSGFEPTGGAPGWSENPNGYRFLTPPEIDNQENPPVILSKRTDSLAAVTSVESVKHYGFTDDMESLEDWSGNINLSEDAVEGDTSLSWVVVPREFQSIEKSFDRLHVQPVPDRMTFDFKIESDTFDYFTLQLTSQPHFQGSNWIVAAATEIIPNQWQRAEIDLTQPDWISGSSLQFERIRFAMINANQPEGAFKVFIDNIQTFHNGKLIEPETRGIQLLFPGTEPTQYFLAQGPSTVIPRTHPVVLARREGISSTQHVTVIRPSSDASFSTLTEFSNRSLVFQQDRIEFDTEVNRYLRATTGYDPENGQNTFELDFLNQLDVVLQDAPIHYRSPLPASVSARFTLAETVTLTYHKTGTQPNDFFVLHQINPNLDFLLLDGEPYTDAQFVSNDDGTIDILLFNPPAGEHRFDLQPSSPTAVQSWDLYEDSDNPSLRDEAQNTRERTNLERTNLR